MGILYYETPVFCGFPSPAMDYMEERIKLDETLIRNPDATFIVQAEGDSMINAFIPPKTKLLVDRSLTAKNGDIVVACVNGDFTVKYLKKNDHKCWLVPANSKYKEMQITEEMDMQIWGVVTTIITETKELRSCMH